MWVIEKADGKMEAIPEDIQDSINELLRAYAARRLPANQRSANQSRAMHRLRTAIENAITNAANGDPLDSKPRKPGRAHIQTSPAASVAVCPRCGKDHFPHAPEICSVCGLTMNPVASG